MQSMARTAHLVVAWLLVAGLVVQVFLAGLGVFGGAANFATHRDWGYLLELLPIVLLVLGLVGRLGRRFAVLAASIFGLFLVQSILIAMRGDAPAVAALHPVNGFVITVLAIILARDAWVAARPAVATT